MSTAKVVNKKPKKTLIHRAIIGVVVTGSIVGIFVFFVLVFGMVRGSELNPNDFQSRDFFYYRIPFSRVQVSPVTYGSRNLPVVNEFAANGMLKGSNVPSEWHVIESTTSSGHLTADAKIFVDHLHERDAQDKYFWSVWNSDNPKQAKVFWPMISKICGQRFYLLIPELFEFARSDIPVDQFESMLEVKLSQISVQLAKDYVRSGDTDSAIRLLTLTVELCPSSATPLFERAKLFKTLDRFAEAKDDEKKAKSLANVETE